MREIPIFQVDAFTEHPFGGNPAAVCPLTSWLPEAEMRSIAAEMNLSETAFFVPRGDDYELRWARRNCVLDRSARAAARSIASSPATEF